MKALLDTHALLWLITDDSRLSQTARQTYLAVDNRLFFSIAGLWEISIKKSIGKLRLSRGWLSTIQKEMRRNGIQWLPIEVAHCAEVANLPFHHRDPFDRIMVAQALVERMHVITRDRHFGAYGVASIW